MERLNASRAACSAVRLLVLVLAVALTGCSRPNDVALSTLPQAGDTILVRLRLDGNFSDIGPSHYRARVKGTMRFGPGPVGQAVLCDGTGVVVVRIPDAPTFRRGVTLAGRFRCDRTTSSATSRALVFEPIKIHVEPRDERVTVSLVPATLAGSFELASKVHGVKAGEWHHVCVTWDSNTASLYLDGVLVAHNSEKREGQAGPGPPGENLFVGKDFQGRVCDVVLIGSALSAADVQALATSLR